MKKIISPKIIHGYWTVSSVLLVVLALEFHELSESFFSFEHIFTITLITFLLAITSIVAVFYYIKKRPKNLEDELLIEKKAKFVIEIPSYIGAILIIVFSILVNQYFAVAFISLYFLVIAIALSILTKTVSN